MKIGNKNMIKAHPYRRHFLIYLILLLIISSFGAGLVIGGQAVRKNYLADSEKNIKKEGINLEIAWEAWEKLNEKFVGDLPQNDLMVYGMTKGLVEALEDPYTVFMEPQEAKQFKENLKGNFDGIGAEIGIRNDTLTIVSPLEGMPAEKAGIKPGDKILRIDEQETGELSLDEAVSNIRGKKGTNVKLTIVSEEDNTPREVEITRGNIDVKSVKWEVKDDNIAYIRLNTFSEDTVKEFAQVAREIKESKAQKIVLDVRGNPGGYLGSAVDIGGFFLPIGSLVAREDFGGKRSAIDYATKNNPVLDNYPIVILINQGSASAAEILAGALNELKGAKLIGEKTFGKGSVQEFLSLSDGSTLKITVAQWLTPKGRVINKEGINPEIEVKFTEEDILNENDVQLTKAIEVLREM